MTMCVMLQRPMSIVVLLCAVAVAACNGMPEHMALDRAVEEEIYGTLPAEKALDKGKGHYREGQFGLAELSFRRAVEQDKTNVEAWLGLAASYDRLQRFDKAGRAYNVVLKLVGRSPAVLNNLGYHFILRGDYIRARATLAEGLRKDPQNEHIRSNVELVASMEATGSWSTHVTADR
jgi:Flp pilus assembly protein TadD